MLKDNKYHLVDVEILHTRMMFHLGVLTALTGKIDTIATMISGSIIKRYVPTVIIITVGDSLPYTRRDKFTLNELENHFSSNSSTVLYRKTLVERTQSDMDIISASYTNASIALFGMVKEALEFIDNQKRTGNLFVPNY